MLLIYGDETQDIPPGTPEFDTMMAGYGAFTAEVEAKGAYKSGDPLLPTAAARTVRVRNGSAMVTNGPFAETAEQLGGYYILDCGTIEEAVAFAAKIPGAQRGSVEVRPILELE
jgi:hypothetical protein